MQQNITQSLWAIIFLFLSVGLSSAITDCYTFSSDNTVYTPINGTTIPTLQVDDALSNPVNIGFSFMFCQIEFTQVKISTNGWVGLGLNHTNPYVNNWINDSAHINKLAPLWDDLNLQYGNVQFLTSGNEPNRVFTVQYSNAFWNDPSFNVCFQVLMHESGKVEFIYGPGESIPFPGATIGMVVTPGGLGNFYSITPGDSATWSITSEDNHVMTYPGANVRYTFTPPAPLPIDLDALSLSGETLLEVGSDYVYTCEIRNVGTEAQSNYTVNLMQGDTILASVPGETIPPASNSTFSISWTPTVAGVFPIFARTVTAGDINPTNDNSNSFTVTVYGNGTTAVDIGTGNQLSTDIPVDFLSSNNWFETIYPATELGIHGFITGVSFYNQFQIGFPNKRIKIWLGSTQQTSLASGWIPSANLVQVFDGPVTFPLGANTITINFASPFDYGNGNLVMMVQRPAAGDQHHYEINQFRCQTVGSNRSRFLALNAIMPEPEPTTAGTVTGMFPQTTFYVTPALNAPQFGSMPESYDFGLKMIDTINSRNISLINMGIGSLAISNIGLSGSPFFSFLNPPVLPISLTETTSLAITIQYHPTEEGSHTAILTVTDNQTRVQHQISISGSCIDDVINSVPYTQNWDNLEVPALPLDWSKITLNSTGSYIRTQFSSPYSQPHTLTLYNSTDTNPTLILVSPRLADNLLISSLRVRFMARCTNGILAFGVLTDPTDPATFEELGQINCAWGTWRERIADFHSYTGNGHYLGFKHCLGGTFRNIDMDDITIETINPNDLAALTITGNPYPIAGLASDYTVNIFNWGASTQSDYLVKIFRADGTELASGPGPTVCQGDTMQATVTWIPAQSGTTVIYAKAVLTNDSNPANDQSTELTVRTLPAGTLPITVGTGNEQARMPFDFGWRYSLYETFYYPEEIGTTGVINGLFLYNNFPFMGFNEAHVKLWLGETTELNLAGGWIPSTQLQLVFDNNTAFPIGVGQVYIPFDTPFQYNGGNLVMMALNPLNEWIGWEYELVFYSQTAGTDRARNYYSIETNPDPEFPPLESTLTGQYPKTTFLMIPGATGSLQGTVTSGGNLLAGVNIALNSSVLHTVTDSNGHYSLPNLLAGTYQVTCSQTGYYPQTSTVVIAVGETTVLNFDLALVQNSDSSTPVASTCLKGCYPNPFNPNTAINYQLKTACRVTIMIYNTKGQKVKTLANEYTSPGLMRVNWDGRDDNNQMVSAGVYTYKMIAGMYSSSKKMILLK